MHAYISDNIRVHTYTVKQVNISGRCDTVTGITVQTQKDDSHTQISNFIN